MFRAKFLRNFLMNSPLNFEFDSIHLNFSIQFGISPTSHYFNMNENISHKYQHHHNYT